MMLRALWMLGLLAWTVPALAEVPGLCSKAEEARARGLSNIEANCTGTNIDGLSCYNAGRLFQRAIGSLEKLYSDDLAKCSGVDRAALDAALARARKVTTLMAREAYAALHVQLAEDHAAHLAYSTLKMYACMNVMNTIARDRQISSDVVRATPEAAGAGEAKPWAGVLAWIAGKQETDRKDSMETRFANAKFHDVCGRVIFSNADGGLTETFSEAYFGVAEKMRSIGFQISDNFLPNERRRDLQISTELDGIIAEFRRRAGDEVKKLNIAHHENPRAADRREAIVGIGPNVQTLERYYPEAWAAYAEVSKWLEGTIGK